MEWKTIKRRWRRSSLGGRTIKRTWRRALPPLTEVERSINTITMQVLP
jgi:hypothetical protein